VISDGGARPNIVPASAATSLYVRAPRADDLRAAMKRVLKIAKGAALMTGTSFSFEISHGKCDFIPNDALHDAIARAMADLPLPAVDAKELAFYRSLASTVGRKDREAPLSMIGAPLELLRGSIHRSVGDFGRGMRIGGSLDTGDVSYVVPTGQMNAAVWPLGVGAHTWQSCAASASSLAFKGMRWAAAVLAATGLELMRDSASLERAKAEHRKKTRPYRSTMDL
jgi:aminobenzoyl-glutamate utilization protein B